MQDENEGLEELPGTVTSGVDLAHAIMMLVVMSDFDRNGGHPYKCCCYNTADM